MNGIIVFSASNDHPLSWLLHRERRHVWCATQCPDTGYWTEYDWATGLPKLRVVGDGIFDLAGWYRAQGFETLVIETGDASFSPVMPNNCVSHVKLILGIDGWAITPHQLYKRMTKDKPMLTRLKQLFSLPGFGGGAPAPPPPPPPPAPVAKKTDEGVQQARRDEKKRARLAAGQGGTVKTPLGGVGEATTTKTLLGQ